MSSDIFDFGFTAVDETELEAVQQAQDIANETSSTVSELEERVKELEAKSDKLLGAIQPLLNNLKANPEKEYIYWPNRIEKVEKFEEHLLNIYGE